MLKLQAHSSNSDNTFAGFVNYQLSAQEIKISFDIHKDKLATHTDFTPEHWDNWGLWEYDVVEVFITKDKNPNHYLELQVSPLNQKLALEIFEPRKVFEKTNPHGVEVQAEATQVGFKANFTIPLNIIPGEEKIVKANFHACLHNKEQNKTYYFSMQANPETKADFHRPEYFVTLKEQHG